MKITFTFWQVIGILIFITICYFAIPWFYNSWMFPEYNEFNSMRNEDALGRFISITFTIIILIVYLGPMNGVRHLDKKRSITLKNPFKN